MKAQQKEMFSKYPPDVELRAFRLQAETAMHDPFYTPDERARRAAYYTAKADEIEQQHHQPERN